MGVSEWNELSNLYVSNLTWDSTVPVRVKSEFTTYQLMFCDELSWSKSPPSAKRVIHSYEWIDLCRGSLYARSNFLGLQIEKNTHQRDDVMSKKNAFVYHNSVIAPRGGYKSIYKNEHLFHLVLPNNASIKNVSFASSASEVIIATPFLRSEFLSLSLMFTSHLEISIIFENKMKEKLDNKDFEEAEKLVREAYQSRKAHDPDKLLQALKMGTDVGELIRKLIIGI